MGWMFRREMTNAARFAPDLLADPDVQRVNRWFPALTVVTLTAPAVAGGLITWASPGTTPTTPTPPAPATVSLAARST
jgi:hypothetical protein